MTGGKQYNNVMDMLLHDEMYIKLHLFLERCNNFFGENQYLKQHYFDKPEEKIKGCSLEVTDKNMYFGQYRNDSMAMSLLEDGKYYHQNSISSKQIIAVNGSLHTDLSPLKEQVDDKTYEEIGWFMRDSKITDDIEAELFQFSTVHDVYSPFEIQEVINRVRNLPIPEKKTLTLNDLLLYPLYNQHIDELLKGY